MGTEGQPAVGTPTPAAAQASAVPAPANQAAADAIAAQAAGAAGAVKTVEQIAAEAPAAQPKEIQYTLALSKDSVLEASAIERITALAKAQKFSPETAQEVLNYLSTEVAADRAKQSDANAQAFQTLARETWPNEIKADKEFGGEKFDATVAESKRAVDRFVTPAEKQILNSTGWGNHPVLVRIMTRVGRALSNDTLVTGGGTTATEQKTTAQLLYGGTQEK